MWDSPTTRGLYDAKTGVYWAVDAFACLLPGHLTDTGDVPPELWRESFLYSNRVGAPWHTMLDLNKFDRHVDQIASLGMTTVASAHATTLRGTDLDEAFRLIRQIARMDAAPLPGQADLDAILAVDRLEVA